MEDEVDRSSPSRKKVSIIFLGINDFAFDCSGLCRMNNSDLKVIILNKWWTDCSWSSSLNLREDRENPPSPKRNSSSILRVVFDWNAWSCFFLSFFLIFSWKFRLILVLRCGVGCVKCSEEVNDDKRSNEDEEAAQAQMLIHKFNVCMHSKCRVLSFL